MKHKYSIGIFIIFLVFILFLTGAIRFGSKAKTEENTELSNQEKILQQSEDSVSTDGHALKEDCFYLMEVNGYIVVYLSDKKTPYEYTDILYDDLPEILRNEIQNGKYIENLEELYGFLENYSS